ncbi:glycosyltransferase family 9 protein [Desulfoplanes formicivorans]|uniref:Glycosyl transferase n=1 Tax=Desulfoplanes formicivorans TaxID=1592317 RepID=A0A194AEM1_9BACT|nr:glycosyltransferase family 9 protein [Desulfoplanes formicivorans]GAU07640.1 glycosyl transferase [Desulfoplanes formicivorans]
MTDTSFLVIRLSHLGDIVLTTGVLDYWHRKHGWTFYFVTTQSMLPILLEHPAIIDVISVTQAEKPFWPWLRFCGFLRKRYGNIPLIDLHGTLRSSMLGAMWPSRVFRYPKLRGSRRLYQYFRHEPSRKRLDAINVPQRYSLAREPVAPSSRELVPRIFLRDQDQTWARKVLAPLGDHPLVALHPYATHKAKQWPREHWCELVSRLHAKGIKTLIIGQSEVPFVRPDSDPCEPTPALPDLDLTNETNLAQTSAILKQVQVLVSGDSGPMHLGTAVGTPVVALFGPTCRQWGFYPSGPRDKVISMNTPCSPCSLHGKGNCSRDIACMREINVTTVLDAILNRINRI